MVRFLAALLLGLAGGLVAAPVGAHEYWLAFSRYQAAPGDTVDVRAFAGTGFRGELKPWAAPRAIRFVMRGPRELDLTRTAVNADPVWARFVTADAAGVLLAYESTFAKIELPGPQFEAYLELEGLDGPLAARRRTGAMGPGRERYARCPKAWVAGSSIGKDAHARALQPVGLTLELVPLADPTRPGPLRVRVLDHGSPLAGALVKAWRQPLDPRGRTRDAGARDSVDVAAHARSGADGVATLPIAGAGEWLISTVHMVPSEDPAEADWQSFWASLTFARSGSARPGAGSAR